MALSHSQAKGLRPVGSGQWTQASGLCGQWTLWPVDYGQGPMTSPSRLDGLAGLWTACHGLWIACQACRRPVTVWGWPVTACGLPVTACGLPVTACGWPVTA